MYIPKPGEPETRLWFISGLATPIWCPHDSYRKGASYGLLMVMWPQFATRSEGQDDAPATATASPRPGAYLN